MFKLVLAEFVVPHSQAYGYRALTYVNMLVSPTRPGLGDIYGISIYCSNTNCGIITPVLENNPPPIFHSESDARCIEE